MASVNMQCPCDKRMLNPLNYPAVLAEMIVPQLESYLATNELTRFLVLRYDSSTLAAVLELRRILGEDTVKVAALVDGNSDSASSSFRKYNGYRGGQRAGGSMRNSSMQAKRVEELFSLANYVVSTNATPPELSSFIASIRQVMLSKHTFYELEPEPQAMNQRSVSPSRSIATITSTMPRGATRHSEKSRPGTSRSAQTMLTEDGRWDGFYDSEEDEIDRILMPIVPRRVHRKGNSRKALKWLGLA